MVLPFSRALDPTSEKSGISYHVAPRRHPHPAQEMLDLTVLESLNNTNFMQKDFLTSMKMVYEVLVGTHYDYDLKGIKDNKGGVKGVLDFLIFPLISRKLIADTYLPERKNAGLINALSFVIAVPMEAIRFGLALCITLLLTPIVALVLFIKSFSAKTEKPSFFKLGPDAKEAKEPEPTAVAQPPLQIATEPGLGRRDIPIIDLVVVDPRADKFGFDLEPAAAPLTENDFEEIKVTSYIPHTVDLEAIDERIQAPVWQEVRGVGPAEGTIFVPKVAADEIRAKLGATPGIFSVGEMTEAQRNAQRDAEAALEGLDYRFML